jgi:hypothetical protein
MRNWATSTPNEWSELGWAALDVADGVLLVASFGGTSVLTGSAKQAAKTGAKQAGRKAGQAAAANSLKGSRVLARKEALQARTRMLLARAGARAIEYKLVRYTVEGGIAVYGFARAVGKFVASPIRAVLAASKRAVATWKSVSPLTKRIVYRSMLASGLYATFAHRTMPMLKEKLTEAVETVGRSFEQVQDVVKKISSGDFSPLKKTGRFAAVVAWLTILGTSVGVTWRVRPREFGKVFG